MENSFGHLRVMKKLSCFSIIVISAEDVTNGFNDPSSADRVSAQVDKTALIESKNE